MQYNKMLLFKKHFLCKIHLKTHFKVHDIIIELNIIFHISQYIAAETEINLSTNQSKEMFVEYVFQLDGERL